jgi:hypothetical protein
MQINFFLKKSYFFCLCINFLYICYGLGLRLKLGCQNAGSPPFFRTFPYSNFFLLNDSVQIHSSVVSVCLPILSVKNALVYYGCLSFQVL